jgi:glutaconate CoA-transferase subunit B
MHPGVSRDDIERNTGWDLRFADKLEETAPPQQYELEVLRDLQARTAAAHGSSGSVE